MRKAARDSRFFSVFTSFILVTGQISGFIPFFTQQKVLAAAPAGRSDLFNTLAAAPRTDVLNPTTGNSTTNSNGSEWYYKVGTEENQGAMGFALGGDTIALGPVDYSSGNSAQRLSWLLDQTAFGSGYRAGESGYSGAAGQRYIYQTDNVEGAYYPSGPQTFKTSADLTGWELCYKGAYDSTDNLSDVWAACPKTYLLIAGGPEYSDFDIDVLKSGESILTNPGSDQKEDVKLLAGDELTLELYRNADWHEMPWQNYKIFVSNCKYWLCDSITTPLGSMDKWEEATWQTDNTYVIPESATDKYIAIYPADSENGNIIGTWLVWLVVGHEVQNINISSCQQLQDINSYGLDNHYTQTDNIDCSATSQPTWGNADGYGFIPIGNLDYPFTGTYDGGGNKISNLFINREHENYIGLFGLIYDGATVSNVNIVDANIKGNQSVGALAGGLCGAVNNSTSSGNVRGWEYVGGLIGEHVAPDGLGTSSPLLYTWDGNKYTYSGDMGRNLAVSMTGKDYTPIDPSHIAAQDGKFSMKISEEYNEIVYYDEVALLTFDHAPGYQVLGTMIRPQDGQFYTIADNPSNPLQSCTDKYGNNCLDALKGNDDKWSYMDKSRTNYYTMNFGDLSSAPRILLVIAGATDFNIKNTSYVKTVQVKDASGNWVDAYPSSQLSYLPGYPYSKVLDLTGKFSNGNYEVRMQFDPAKINYVAVDTSTQQSYTLTTTHASKADLGFMGFTKETFGNYRDHDYSQISSTPNQIFQKQGGFFTKYGNVLPLLESTNNQFVIMAPGDAMYVEFNQSPQADGTTRSYMLYSWANYKHAYKTYGKTVDPLPFNGMTSYPYSSPQTYPYTPENNEYINTWNTRYIQGLPAGKGSTVTNSSSSVIVSGQYTLGGLVGYNDKLITGSHATGSVTGTNQYYSGQIGGLVGYNDSNGEIENSYAKGDISGSTEPGDYYYSGVYSLGGLVGENGSGTINDSYSEGNVSATVSGESNAPYIWNNFYTGGIGGFIGSSDGIISNSHSTGDVDVLLDVHSTGSSGQTYFSNEEIGGFIGNNNSSIFDSYSSGDVNTSDTSSVVVGMQAYHESDEIGGFAGYTDDEIDSSTSTGDVTVSNARLINLDEDSNNNYDIYEVGGFTGYNDSNVYGSSSSGSVIINSVQSENAQTSEIGGFVGYNDESIGDSYSKGDVTGVVKDNYSDGSQNVGGFAGKNDYGNISESFAMGNVVGGNNVGGFAGYNNFTISDSFSRGNVSGDDNVGGFMGLVENGNSEVSNTYTTSNVSLIGLEGTLGAYAGTAYMPIYYSFFDNQKSGITEKCGDVIGSECDGVNGKSTVDMKDVNTFTTDLGINSWDFERIWGIKATVNNGYPYIKPAMMDTDGISPGEELSAPNNGDVNQDDTPDAAEDNVASFLDPVNKSYTTLEIPDTCQIVSVNVTGESANSKQDVGFDYPAGLMNYTMICPNPGMTATVTMYYFNVSPAGLFLRKYNAGKLSYTAVTGATMESVTIGGVPATKVTYEITDGGALDQDGVSNGLIIDPIGLGEVVIGAPKTGYGFVK